MNGDVQKANGVCEDRQEPEDGRTKKPNDSMKRTIVLIKN